MNKIIKNTLILTAITVVSGLLLGIVYDVTKEPIAQAQERTKQKAFQTVLPEASEFTSSNFDEKEAAKILKENGYTDANIPTIDTTAINFFIFIVLQSPFCFRFFIFLFSFILFYFFLI